MVIIMSDDKMTNIMLGLILGLVFAVFMLLISRTERNQTILLVPQQTPTEQYVIPQPVHEGQKRQTEKTKIVMSRPTTISGTARLLQLSGKGKIDELSVITTNPNARISIMVDGRQLINESISSLRELSTYANWLGIQELDNETVVVVSDLSYDKGIEVKLSTSQPATVKMIGKYREVV